MMIDFTVGHLIEQTRKKNANPGGGALVSLIGNLAINLLLMMDKKTYENPEIEKNAINIRKKLLDISKKLEFVMQDDIDKVDLLVKAYKNKESQQEINKKTLDVIKPPEETINLVIEAMELSNFILENGKLNTISDGEIATRLMKETVLLSIINIDINRKNITYKFEKNKIIEKCRMLYERNMKIIEGRNK